VPRRRTKKRLREPVNGLTHLAGVLLACVGLLVLLARATSAGRTDQIVAFGIFGLSLVVLFGNSLRLSSSHAAADEDGSDWPSASRERSRPRSWRVNFQLKGL